MKYLVDYHVHTHHSFDSRVAMEEYCKKGIEIGLAEIVFTEHFDLNPFDTGLGLFNYQKYTQEIEECREKYGDKIQIKKGLELGEPHLYVQEHGDFFVEKSFDFLLGSVHYLGDDLLDAPFSLEERALYLKYFQEILKTAQQGNYHVLGHLDVLKRYVPSHFNKFCAVDYQEIIREILKIVISRGKGIEVNTSGFRQGLGEPLPTIEVLKWYHELGGQIVTVGSDAHYLKDLGRDLERGIKIIKDLGFQGISSYTAGEVNIIKI